MRAKYIAVATLFAVAANAQYRTNFEDSEGYQADPSGVSIVGQQGWYQPIPGSADGLVVRSGYNRFGTVHHPEQEENWLTCAADADMPYIVSRAEHQVTFTNTEWTLTYDFNGQFLGNAPATDFLGGVSLQPSLDCNGFQTTLRWNNVMNPTEFSALYGVADAGGLPSGQQFTNFVSPGPAWEHLPTNHWFRSTTTWDFRTGRVTLISIRDLSTGGPKTFFEPTDWFLAGGVYNKRGRTNPTALRVFSGGSSSGNVVSYDLVNVRPPGQDTLLAPYKEVILLGTTRDGGDLHSWEADDGNSRTICKFFVPNIVTPFLRIDLSYQIEPRVLTDLRFKVKVNSATPGPLAIDLSFRDQSTHSWIISSVNNAPLVFGRVYEGIPTGALQRYVDIDGRIEGEIGIWRRGPSTSFYPCVTFEYGTMEVQR